MTYAQIAMLLFIPAAIIAVAFFAVLTVYYCASKLALQKVSKILGIVTVAYLVIAVVIFALVTMSMAS